MKTILNRICLLSIGVVFGLVGCGGDPSTSSTPFPNTVTTSTNTPVAIAPVITTHPLSVTVFEGESATFSVKVQGTETVSYQWRRNGVNIPNATDSAYTIQVAALTDSGIAISVAIKGTGGTTVSADAKLTVAKKAPSIVTQPSAVSVEAGKLATFSVTATGFAPLTYQWSRNGVPIAGAQSQTYETRVSFEDNGAQFSVKVSNAISSVTSQTVNLTVLPSVLKSLVISEVSSCSSQDTTPVSCWFEVYNPTSAAIDLSKFLVKSTGWDISTKQPVAEMTFALPSISVPNGGYVIVSGNPDNFAQLGSQNAYIRFGNIIPHWTQSGFVELLSIATSDDRRSTVDFVSFGNSTQTPTTLDQWTGAPAGALAFGSTELGQSIVRLYPRTTDTDTNSAADWTSVRWATPAGRNDVPADAVDEDGDGIPDSAEVAGGTFAGLDLYAMGARKSQKDLFVEIDHMNPLITTTVGVGQTATKTDYGIIPRAEALQKVVAAFASQNIKVWFDTGTLFSPIFSVQNFNLGQSTHKVPFENCVSFDPLGCTLNTTLSRTIYDWKNQYMDLRRRPIFHYMLFGNSQNADGKASNSGLAETVGNDALITMGDWGFSVNTTAGLNLLVNQQAATVMHELGHNLGLQHGGNSETNYKPNYWSVMNYLYQLNGLDPDASSMTAYQRWLIEKGDSTKLAVSALVGSPEGPQGSFVIDYSDGKGIDLDENNLSEANNVGRNTGSSTTYADWNMSNTLTVAPLVIDLNKDGVFEVLTDYNDWGNLIFPFARQANGNAGAPKVSVSKIVVRPMANDRQPVAKELPPSPELLRRIRAISTP